MMVLNFLVLFRGGVKKWLCINEGAVVSISIYYLINSYPGCYNNKQSKNDHFFLRQAWRSSEVAYVVTVPRFRPGYGFAIIHTHTHMSPNTSEEVSGYTFISSHLSKDRNVSTASSNYLVITSTTNRTSSLLRRLGRHNVVHPQQQTRALYSGLDTLLLDRNRLPDIVRLHIDHLACISIDAP
jgi:hypothetical protein